MLDAQCCFQVYVDENQGDSRETFVYVNGICTTSRMARATGLELAQMMHKNVTVVHNPTDSALMDLGEVCRISHAFSKQLLRCVVAILEVILYMSSYYASVKH